jgi:hypothetical protein
MQTVDQMVDGGRGILLDGFGEMDIARRGGGTDMPQQGLDLTQAQAVFQQMCGKAVAQGVYRDFFLIPH